MTLSKFAVFLAAVAVVASSSAARAADKTVLIALVASNARAAFTDAAAAYEKSHPDVHVQASYVGSKTIMAQVEQGAAADVILASSSAVSGSTGVDAPHVAFKNHTAIVVAKSAAGKVHEAKDLAKPGIRVAAGVAGSVTAGFETDTVAKLAGLYGKDFETKYAANVVARKTDNEKIVAVLGENDADAAILFAADAESAKVALVALPADAQVSVGYSVASVKASSHPAQAKDFAAFLSGPEAAAIFKAHHHDGA